MSKPSAQALPSVMMPSPSRSQRRPEPESPRPDRPRKPWSPASGILPRWVAEELARVTPKARLEAAVEALTAAARDFAQGRLGRAYQSAETAKKLSPRDATAREVMALSAYRMGRWDSALRELRAFRRMTGETLHMPVEMDVLRALERPGDVEEAWGVLRRRGGDRTTLDEGRVVYGSFLLDQGRDSEAWKVTDPKRMNVDARESELRVWYVAARAAARLGDTATARRIYQAIERADTAFPGLDELDRAIGD